MLQRPMRAELSDRIDAPPATCIPVRTTCLLKWLMNKLDSPLPECRTGSMARHLQYRLFVLCAVYISCGGLPSLLLHIHLYQCSSQPFAVRRFHQNKVPSPAITARPLQPRRRDPIYPTVPKQKRPLPLPLDHCDHSVTVP